MSKKKYCKFCGLELEKDVCTCDDFALKKDIVSSHYKTCDTCGKKIDFDSKFCEYCGLPTDVDGNIVKLKKELRGENAIDVIKFYKEKDKDVKKANYSFPFSFVFSVALTMLVVGIGFGYFLRPVIKRMIDDYNIKKMLNAPDTSETDNLMQYKSIYEEETVVETSEVMVEPHDKWVKVDGYYYCYDDEGLPVIDDWVTEVDEDGNEQKFYFDVDGKLVVNSWIDGEYYVGSDGAMLRDTDTPDGAHVDEDGRVLLMGGEEVSVVTETFVYYEAPNEKAETKASTQKSSTSGEIKGVDPEKKYELYVKSIRGVRDTITKGDLKCNLIYYIPVMDGASEREVKNINEKLEEAFNEKFIALVRDYAIHSIDLPKSITFNIVEQRTLNSNRMNILIHGRLTPRKGLSEKLKFRFVYDRKSKEVMVANITE